MKKQKKQARLRKNLVTVEDVEAEFSFGSRSIHSFYMGLSGKNEEIEQKAFFRFLQAEFPDEIGFREIPDANPVYTRLIVSVADFYDSQRKPTNPQPDEWSKEKKWFSTKMKRYKSMGYQLGAPDITILSPIGGYKGFVSEMKSKVYGAKPTPQQLVTITALQEAGYAADFDYGFPAAALRWCRYVNNVL